MMIYQIQPKILKLIFLLTCVYFVRFRQIKIKYGMFFQKKNLHFTGRGAQFSTLFLCHKKYHSELQKLNASLSYISDSTVHIILDMSKLNLESANVY